ncbi:MAG: tRNA dihydrouridine(20/20a) synthase DusA [Methylococcales bacterium]|nr:tRNA dihydrouridine(20/20a) synthase DusA [Methylococcales bacterium]
MSIENHLFSVAPMLDWTDRHCRYFYRLMSKKALLYTEMVTTGALIHANQHRFLQFNPEENPLALQLGGSIPHELALCARMAQDYGYDEVNLNVGCPSDRVQNGQFGACLMAKPTLVAECINAMTQAVCIPVTVKSRIGIDHQDSYQALSDFIEIIADAGCQTFIIHARKAWLQGLSPKQNRNIPPLRYDIVYRLKQDYPHLNFILNGGITDLDQIKHHLLQTDGVMLGREVYNCPFLLAEIDPKIYGTAPSLKKRSQIIEELLPYIDRQLNNGIRLHSITRHILGLFHSQKGARNWRRYLSEQAVKKNADKTVLLEALKFTE